VTAFLHWMALLSSILGGVSLMSSDSLPSVSREQLCITEGQILRLESQWMRVDSTKMRAVLGTPSRAEAELRFRYQGETRELSRLRSGTERTQIGLKLRAQDDCNVVYVMWRIDSISKLVVSIKSNPGQRTQAECENRGYNNMKAARERPLPEIEKGSEHSLRAALNRTSLVVSIDGVAVWEGNIADDALRFDGPVGLRSDNASFDFQFFARPENGAFSCGRGLRE
jgi:hypothetical protein